MSYWCLNPRGPPKHQKEADNMSATTRVVEIPAFQTAEQLIAFLLSEFMFMYAMNGMILLTNSDLFRLSDDLQRFMNSSARSDSRTVTDNHKKEEN